MEWVSNFSERFKVLTEHQTYQQISDFLEISKTAISYYLSGQRKPKAPALKYIASRYGVNPLWLMGGDVDRYAEEEPIPDSDDILSVPTMRRLPLLGTIACGDPILAEENIEGFLLAPDDVDADFCLRCKGDSMINARIFDGDIVYIRQQPKVENGEIAAVLIDDEATLKRVRYFGDHISLEPENPQYRPLVFWGDEMQSVRVLGKAVAFMAPVN